MTTQTVTLYKKPSCVQCDMTKRWLNDRGVEYQTLDVTESEDALETVKNMGYLAAPVVTVSGVGVWESWSGFRPDLLAQHVTIN